MYMITTYYYVCTLQQFAAANTLRLSFFSTRLISQTPPLTPGTLLSYNSAKTGTYRPPIDR